MLYTFPPLFLYTYNIEKCHACLGPYAIYSTFFVSECLPLFMPLIHCIKGSLQCTPSCGEKKTNVECIFNFCFFTTLCLVLKLLWLRGRVKKVKQICSTDELLHNMIKSNFNSNKTLVIWTETRKRILFYTRKLNIVCYLSLKLY